MEYIGFGSTGIRVSPVCLGTMTFGKEADETASLELMDRAFELGVNFFDTANIYNKGVTEQIVGRWLKSHRSAVVLASKAHFATGEGPNDRGSSRRHLLMEIDKILSRLQTDWLDILYLHHWDPRTPIEETLSALTALVDAGKVRYCGVSNFSAWQVMKAVGVSQRKGFAPIACVQPMYNLVKRQAEVEILPMALSEGLAVCPYNPLAAGLLTGKYRRGEKGRLDENPMYKVRYGNPVYAEIADRFVAYAREMGHSPAALAVAWVMAHPAVTSVIIGARNAAQLQDTLGCLDITLSPAAWSEISGLSSEPPLATDRSEERQAGKGMK
ncbi:MAG TPA: aldo/keto reductase [Candidatus Hydrogenedentes bacterium]|nr:aldo/keto reductase [Candidatus Hydrogenedentota bacterium]HQE84388.1 aldo/keto reductase [Candidatus Hydrogenedentota bacterium]